MLDITKQIITQACENKIYSRSSAPLAQHVACKFEIIFDNPRTSIALAVQNELTHLGFTW